MSLASTESIAASSARPAASVQRVLRSGGERQPICVFVGNHASMHGIGEILYSLYTTMAAHHSVVVSPSIRPDAVNVIIDEFSNPMLVAALRRVKERHPRTRYIVVATEFITDVFLLGLGLGRTFNFFGTVGDWKALIKTYLRRAVTGRHSYLHRRYTGFIEVLSLCDLLLATHPAILTGLAIGDGSARKPQPLLLYPEIALDFSQTRLEELPFGFTVSGTLTRFRRRCVRKLLDQLDDLNRPVYKYTPFSASRQLVLSSAGFGFDREMDAGEYLFNLNPPQSANWPYSSPMRILRAALLGQIPVVTKKFGDHPIERIAQLWDPRESAVALWHAAEFDRESLVMQYIHSIAEYNAFAKSMNSEVLAAISAVGNAH